jgi:hypothetical protein
MPSGQHIGSQRNCGFQLKSSMGRCTAGNKTKLSCSLKVHGKNKTNAISYVVRVCESSAVLKAGVACDYDTALKNKVIQPSSTSVIQFICPGYRDDDEQGGLYSVYTAPIMQGLDHPQTTVNCKQIE